MEANEGDDAVLVARAARGDGDAIATIYRRYLPLVLRWSLRETENRELAADLTAEVFAASLLAARRYDPGSGTVGAWLLGIAKNKLRESRRRRRVERSARRRLRLEPVALTDVDLERVDELTGMDTQLQELVTRLPPEQRRAVVARIVEERSYAEIADELRCSQSVVPARQPWTEDPAIGAGGAMNDYFDRLELQLRAAAEHGQHRRWYERIGLPRVVRGRGLVVVLVGLAAVATPAVGAVAGWFGTGRPVSFHPPSATVGLGVVPRGGERLLAVRAADPDGGPPWGMRLVRTTRGDACIQIGRVQGGQLGSLGIDNAFHNDHEFHAIRANDTRADICAGTDGDGHAFVNMSVHDTPASIDVPLDDGTETASPQQGMRMVFAGLLGPEARSITYRTPSGQTRTVATTGPEGAYLFVFRQTFKNCFDFETRMPGETCGAGEDVGTDVRAPTAIASIAYAGGETCEVPRPRYTLGCRPVGWVAAKPPRVTRADVTSPIEVHVTRLREAVPTVSVKASFTARRPVTSTHSLYDLAVRMPNGGAAVESATNADIRRGARITLTFEQQVPPADHGSSSWRGRYHATVSYVPDLGTGGRGLYSHAVTVGRFSFTLPKPQ